MVYVGVVVVLGITSYGHPLLKDRKFQTQGGDTRLYVMPFSNSSDVPVTTVSVTSTPCITWQVSFPLPDERVAKELCSSPELLKREVLNRCRGWHAPISEFLCSTPETMIMGTPVYDSNPVDYSGWSFQGIPNKDYSRTVLVGDAAHPMSPFQGQGANQALLDSLSLTNYLYRVVDEKMYLTDSIRQFWSEMSARAGKKLHASRARAINFHSSCEFQKGMEHWPKSLCSPRILSTLRENNVNAMSENLDDLVVTFLREQTQVNSELKS
eukprot:TRINITY_DN11423_c0_g2_i1.p1 TRINITY_DN11423_c0_g2~~TRINITY_DN11423_c0_g2_i1.p1  ORF type:complete len:268 (-),score=45.88 TRINITY_DN11423_c0_g2_i1:118-921(-)